MEECKGQRNAQREFSRGRRIPNSHACIWLTSIQCRLAFDAGPPLATHDPCKIKVVINESGEYLDIAIPESCRLRFWFDDFPPNLAGLSEEYTGGKGAVSPQSQPTDTPPLIFFDIFKVKIDGAVDVRIVNFELWSEESKTPGLPAPYPPVDSEVSSYYPPQLGLGSKNSVVWQVIATDSDNARVTYSKVSFTAGPLAGMKRKALKCDVVHHKQVNDRCTANVRYLGIFRCDTLARHDSDYRGRVGDWEARL